MVYVVDASMEHKAGLLYAFSTHHGFDGGIISGGHRILFSIIYCCELVTVNDAVEVVRMPKI